MLNLFNYLITMLGTGGQVDLKLIYGIRIAGMSHKIKKEDKVSHYSFLYFILCSSI